MGCMSDGWWNKLIIKQKIPPLWHFLDEVRFLPFKLSLSLWPTTRQFLTINFTELKKKNQPWFSKIICYTKLFKKSVLVQYLNFIYQFTWIISIKNKSLKKRLFSQSCIIEFEDLIFSENVGWNNSILFCFVFFFIYSRIHTTKKFFVNVKKKMYVYDKNKH